MYGQSLSITFRLYIYVLLAVVGELVLRAFDNRSRLDIRPVLLCFRVYPGVDRPSGNLFPDRLAA